MTIKERFLNLKVFAESYTSRLQKELQTHTGIGNFRIFVHDEFIDAFPEDHVTRSGHVMISLRFSIDLKGLDHALVEEVKRRFAPRLESLQILRPNFEDTREDVAFDWHISESEREKDEGKEFAELVWADAESLSVALQEMIAINADRPVEDKPKS